MTRIEVPGTHNFRPVDGVRAGALYRSDGLSRLTRQGRRMLLEMGIRRVIDLRTSFDRRMGGADRLRGVGADVVKLPILSGGVERNPSAVRLDAVYRSILSEHGATVGQAIRSIADAPDGAVLVHCTAGKDRTGLVCGLVQLAVGVPMETVLDDYVRSELNLSGAWSDRMLAKIRRFRVAETPELVLAITGSPRSMLVDTLAWVDAQYGGLPAYLTSIGVDEQVIAALRARLTP